MINTLYEAFQHWSKKGSVYILSDLHLDDKDSLLMDPDWIPPEEQIWIINNIVTGNDTFICLGDVGSPEYARQIRASHKVLLLGNHDRRKEYRDVFDEIYEGPLFISEKILLSHEPVYGLSWCLNIHGHDHNGMEKYADGCNHLNLAANVCGYTPVSLGKLIKEGVLSDIDSIHRETIDRAAKRKRDSRDKKEVLSVIEHYKEALALLDAYDHQNMARPKGSAATYMLTYEECRSVIDSMRFGNESELFGREKDDSFKGSIGNIYQSFDGDEIYPTVQEKAANFLYFVTKNHSFVDGNKRIAATMFLYFLDKNGMLFDADDNKLLEDYTLVALTIMIAESKPEEKEMMISVVMNCMKYK